jgi:hypothetical protein
MNPWYIFIVTGLAFTLDNLVSLISDRSSDSVTLTAKQRRITNIVRASSGLIIMGFAWLTILRGWSQSDLRITLTSVQESIAYAFSVAGAFRMLAGTVTTLVFRFLDSKTSFNQEINKVWLGAYMFVIGGLAVVWIDRDTSPVLVPMVSFICVFFFIVAIHYFSTRPTKSKPPNSTTNKP